MHCRIYSCTFLYEHYHPISQHKSPRLQVQLSYQTNIYHALCRCSVNKKCCNTKDKTIYILLYVVLYKYKGQEDMLWFKCSTKKINLRTLKFALNCSTVFGHRVLLSWALSRILRIFHNVENAGNWRPTFRIKLGFYSR